MKDIPLFDFEASKEEKLKLYDTAKEKYYEGNPIMSDIQFDELENSLDLENEGYVGSKSSKYTESHLFLMGSLSKIQIKNSDESGKPDWNLFAEKCRTYMEKARSTEKEYEATPKYDGCSFEIILNAKGIVSASTRGDGEKGKDIFLLMKIWQRMKNIDIHETYRNLVTRRILTMKDILIIRGEIIVDKFLFESNLADMFNSPRSYATAISNKDWSKEENVHLQPHIDNIEFISYDFRKKSNDTIVELPYQEFKNLITLKTPSFIKNFYYKDFTGSFLESLYHEFEKVRDEIEYALDGFVIKPHVDDRLQELERERPRDCVAIKFLPEIKETVINNIEWKLGKTGELFPTAIVKPVILLSKSVSRVSLHGYDFVSRNKIGIGSRVKISMSGDIIPFLYSVESCSDDMNIPDNAEVTLEDTGTSHLKTSIDYSGMSLYFSILSLNVPFIGLKAAEKIQEKFGKEYSYAPEIMNEDFYSKLRNEFGERKSTEKMIQGLEEVREKLSITDVILSMNIQGCGKVSSSLCESYFRNENPDFKGINSESYAWIYNKESKEYIKFMCMANQLNLDFSTRTKDDSNVIKVILTGSIPSHIEKWKTKSDFLKDHPNFQESTKWNEVDLLITGDLMSNSSKMKKAKEKNIKIKTYEDFL